MTTNVSRALAVVVTALIAMAVVQPAGAHESRETGGYTAVVGWADEPAYTGFPNAVNISLTDSAGEPVEDLGDELQVEVLFGDETTGLMPLEAAFDEPGLYQADVIPTRAGTYSFHFTGTIGDEPYDETFASGEDTFAQPQNPAEVSFPAQDPTNGELAQSIEQLQSEVGSDGSGSSSTTGFIGIGLGAVALLVALGALLKSRAG